MNGLNEKHALVEVALNNEVKIANAGGISLILPAMKTHLKNEQIQECAFWVLGSSGANSDNQVKISNGGGIELILSAMRTYGKNISIQSLGAKALNRIRSTNPLSNA